jgi:Peptidase family M23
MKKLVRLCLLTIVMLPGRLMAQQDSSIHLICPLNEATVVPPPKNALKLDLPDLCIVLVSIPDTTVKAVANGRITNVEFDEETQNGVVMYARLNGKDYYFWYVGMNKLVVHKNELVKVGQPLGYVSPGNKIEMNMYQFETPLDPTKYMDCKGVLKNE